MTLLEKVDHCLLADLNLVSDWVKKELGTVESVKITRSRLVIISFSHPERAGTPRQENGDNTCYLLCSQEQGAIERRDY